MNDVDPVELERRHGLEVYPQRGIAIVEGSGARVTDSAGREYIDCTAGIGVASIGHAHPALAEAVAAQARRLVTCPGIFANDVRAELMARLADVAPRGLSRVFLCNSGTEANEAAIKFARLATGRRHFVSLMRGFHGRTLGALSATHKYRDEFEPLVPGHSFVPLDKVDKLEAAVDENTAGVIVELVQGEGGVRPASHEFVAAARALCKERGALLIVDEVQTGFGRTGRMFACEHHDLAPDLLCLAKAMAGGVPMGAVLVNESVAGALGKHGSTFGGNPLACAAALATLEVIEREGLCRRAAVLGERFRERFEADRPGVVRAVRQLGLMIGIELRVKARPHLEALMAGGVLALPAGPTVVRLLPPLVISEEDLDAVVRRLHEVLA